jgi:hypothetical protein
VTSARTGGAGIAVQNGSQLTAMIGAASAQQTPAPQGGIVNLTTSGAGITVDNSSIKVSGAQSAVNFNTGAAGGSIALTGGTVVSTVDSRGNVAPGSAISLNTQNASAPQLSSINLTNASLTADVLKIQALGTNGQITIGGGTISGNSQLELYAGDIGSHTTGLIEFVANTTLSSNVAAVLAANTVKIDGGAQVDVTGPAINVYTNNADYNTGNFGNFTGNGVASTAPFSSAPAPSGVKGRVVGTWTIGGHRITAISTPVSKPTAGKGTASAVQLASLANSARPGSRRPGKIGAERQGGRHDNTPPLQTVRPMMARQRQ